MVAWALEDHLLPAAGPLSSTIQLVNGGADGTNASGPAQLCVRRWTCGRIVHVDGCIEQFHREW